MVGPRKARSRFCWYGASRSQRIGAKTPVNTFAVARTTPSNTYGLYQIRSAMNRQNQDAHTPVLKARMRLTTGLAVRSGSRHSTPATQERPKKMPKKREPVP